MANKKSNLTVEEADSRANAAIVRLRERLAHCAAHSDLSFKPLNWFRERWHDKTIRRKFIETFIKVRDALNENEIVDFKFNDIQSDLWERLSGKDVVLKMRRGGLSTLFQAIGLANAIMRGGYKVRAVPHDTDTAAEFRENIKTMFESLPPDKRPPTRFYNERRILFASKSGVTTQTVQSKREKKGRGLAINYLHATEVAFWEGDARKALISLMSAAEGGDIVLESTANGVDEFEARYQDGKRGRGGWRSHFYQWWWRRSCRLEGAEIVPAFHSETFYLVKPGERFADLSGQRLENARLTRREMAVGLRIYRHLKRLGYVAPVKHWRNDWHRAEVAAYIAWRRAKIEDIGEREFLIEYPENDRECFAQTGRPVIPQEFLKVSCSFQSPQTGHEYSIGVDTAGGGTRGNPAAIEVIDVCCGAQVFEEKLKIKPDLLAHRVAELCDLYFRARLVVERNNTGIATINTLRDLGYEDVLYRHLSAPQRRAIDKGEKTVEEAMDEAEFGFPTDKINKPLAGIAIEKAVRTGELALASEEFCQQAKKVVWKDNGSFSGQTAADEDDLFMALAIVWFVHVTMHGFFSGFVGVIPEFGEARVE